MHALVNVLKEATQLQLRTDLQLPLSAPSNNMTGQPAKNFPDISTKLTAPTKRSAFERQKAEAEAKRKRQADENAAALESFVKSFDGDDEDGDEESAGPPPKKLNALAAATIGSTAGGGGPGKRHFAPAGPRSGSGPGSLGLAPQGGKRRAIDELRSQQQQSQPQRFGKEKVLLGFEDNAAPAPSDAARPFAPADEDDEESKDEYHEADRAAPKPTLQLTCLPPGSSQAFIKSLIPDSLTIDAIRVLPPSGPNSQDPASRKSTSAIVTLAQDTAGNTIDNAVNGLQNRYLGRGYYLSLSRHLSSSALAASLSTISTLNNKTSTLPFGAKESTSLPSYGRAPPRPTHRAFAPPSSYNPTQRPTHTSQVAVRAPSSLAELKLIHKTLEALITHGPEFEALLMTRPQVQRDEKWAWLWNARSTGGVWYRWRLWEIQTGLFARRRKQKHTRFPTAETHKIFEGPATAPWLEPERSLPQEYTTRFDDLAQNSDYSSDSSSDSETDRRRRDAAPPRGRDPEPHPTDYLTPLHRAKYIHLLSRLPTTPARLRKGDVARATAFAIAHAAHGAAETVDLLVRNVLRPFNCSWHATGGAAVPSEEPTEKQDTTPSTTVALHTLTDLLFASTTGDASSRTAWRYRSRIEAALQTHRVFARLGRIERDLGWGRMRADKWRRSVMSTLAVWEGSNVFGDGVHAGLVREFEEAAKEGEGAEGEKKGSERGRGEGHGEGKTKWKTLSQAGQEGSAGEEGKSEGAAREEAMDVDGEPIGGGDVDGEPMEDVDGVPMEDDAPVPAEEQPVPRDEAAKKVGEQDGAGQGETAVTPGLNEKVRARTRPTAEDMFASDEE